MFGGICDGNIGSKLGVMAERIWIYSSFGNKFLLWSNHVSSFLRKHAI